MGGKRTRHVARLCTPNVQVQRDVGDVHEQVSWQKEPGNQHMHVLPHRIVTLKNGVNQKADHLHCCDAAETVCVLFCLFLTSSTTLAPCCRLTVQAKVIGLYCTALVGTLCMGGMPTQRASGRSKGERHDYAWGFLRGLPEDIFQI